MTLKFVCVSIANVRDFSADDIEDEYECLNSMTAKWRTEMKKKRIHNYLRVSNVVLCLVFTIVLSVRVVSADSPEDMTHKEVPDPGVSLKLCYQIESSYNRNYCINVKSNSSHNGTNIQLFNADRTSACQWVYKPVKWDSSYKHLYYMIYNYRQHNHMNMEAIYKFQSLYN